MKRLTFFVKGNVDVHDSLHSCRIGGELEWNGINEILRSRHPDCTARVRHETWTRSDALLHCTGTVPEAIAARSMPLGSYPPTSQFSRAIFETKSDVVVLSVQPDITVRLMKHREQGFLFYANDPDLWTPEDRAWLKSEFASLPRLTLEESMANLSAIIGKIREQSDAPILIYNLSPIIPGEWLHCHQGVGESYSNRIRKFNLGLIELSETTGISVIDVDSIVARHGADVLKLDTVHLNPAGYRLVAEEVLRVLEDLSVLG